MNRKTKIIVSVVGIVIVTLALLGITYAYYLTRIEGNTNTNSISLTTANLLLKYDDGSGAIVEENIMPGATFTKTFSVTNEGNATVDNYVVYLEEIINDLTRTQDLTYTLTCDRCAGSEGVYPKFAGIIATNTIEVGVTHNYTLTVTYENLTNVDQSIDMGSTINGYIQIYNLTDIVDITGSVVNSQDGDYVQINSEPKISQIIDGKYMLGAIEPGSHTITVRYKDSNGDEQIRSTKDIVIQKGNETKVEGNVITVTNDSQTVTLNINATDGNSYEITNTIKEYNPFNEGTLAFNIYNNARDNKNGTSLLLNGAVETVVGDKTNEFKLRDNSTKHNPDKYVLTKTLGTRNYLAYACDYELKRYYDEAGYEYDLFSLIDTPGCPVTISDTKFDFSEEMINEIKGKYAVWESRTSNLYTTELEELYKISDNTSDFDIENYKIKYAVVKKYISTENNISRAQDDYGSSYYYRGDVVDNYINYAGMCWRIVRIQGDGSIKLILEDQDELCSYNMNGNWNIPVSNDDGAYTSGNFGYRNTALGQKVIDYLNESGEAVEYERSMATAFKNFQTTKLSSYLGDLKSGNWCITDSVRTESGFLTKEEINNKINNFERVNYDVWYKNTHDYSQVLKCSGTKMDKFGDKVTDMYVGTITAGEAIYAGYKTAENNTYIYLYNDYVNNDLQNFTLSPAYLEGSSDGNGNTFIYWIGKGFSIAVTLDLNLSFRPSIVLKENINLNCGDGTKNNPYEVVIS